MATTRLVGKTQRRRARTEREQLARKNDRFMPVIKKVDDEELKASFKKKPAKAKKEEAPKTEETKEVKKAAPKKAETKKDDTPKAEKKAPAKKKAAPKAKKED